MSVQIFIVRTDGILSQQLPQFSDGLQLESVTCAVQSGVLSSHLLHLFLISILRSCRLKPWELEPVWVIRNAVEIRGGASHS